MSYLKNIIELIQKFGHFKDESSPSEAIKKKREEARIINLVRTYEIIKKNLPEENLPLLIYVLKRFSNLNDEEFSHFLASVFSGTDKDLLERSHTLEKDYQKCSQDSNIELPARLLKDFPTAASSKAGFNCEFFYEILSFTDLIRAIEKIGNSNVHAYKLCVLFDNKEDLFNYFKSFENEHKGSEHIVHDACLFDLPNDNPTWNLNIWRKLAKQHLASNEKFRKLFPFAGEIEKRIPFLTEKTKVAKLDDIYAQLNYERSQENPGAAIIFHKNGISKESFSKYLDEILPRAKDSSRIPDVDIIADQESKSSYYLKKIDPHDPRAAILGKKTSCCQFIGGQGELCTIHGITSEEGGFYVVHEGEPDNPKPQDEIVAQCWAWRSKSQALVYDSIEFSINIKEDIKNLISQLYITLANHLVSEPTYKIPLVTVGTGGQTPNTFGINGVGRLSFLEEFIDYAEYCDSQQQRLVAVRGLPLLMASFTNAEKMLLDEKFKHWVQSCVSSDNEEILKSLKQSISEEKHDEINEIIENSQCLKAECQKEVDKINWDLLDKLSSLEYCIDLPDQAGRTLLERVFYKNDLNKTQRLLEHGTDIEKLKRIIKLQLQFSYNYWIEHALSPEFLDFLLNKKLINIQELKEKNSNIYFIMRRSALEKRWDLVRVLVENGVDIENNTYAYSPNESILSIAIEQGNLTETKWLLTKGAHVSEENLNKAAEKGYWSILESLAESNPDNKNKALHLASEKDQWDLVKKFIAKGGRSIEKTYPVSALSLAAAKDRWDIVQLFMEAGSFEGCYALTDVLYYSLRSENWGMTCWLIKNSANCEFAMLYLAEQKIWDKVKELFSNYDADINAIYNETLSRYPEIKGWYANSLLVKAAMQENIEMMQWLLDEGALLSNKDYTGSTCFIRAVQAKKNKTIEYLTKNYVDQIQDDLLLALIHEIRKISNSKQSTSPDLNQNDSDNSVLVDWKYLIKLINNVNGICAWSSQTALTAACTLGEPGWEIIEYLVLERKADVNINDKHNDNALLCLCRSSHVSVEKIQWLHKLGANIQYEQKREPILWWPCFYSNLAVVKYLVANGANIGYKNSCHENLVIATIKGFCNLELLEWLIVDQKLNIDDRNNQGQTALLIAATFGRWPAASKLVELGADINVSITQEYPRSSFDVLLGKKATEKRLVINTILTYAVNTALRNQELWEKVEYFLNQPNIDLTKNGIHAEALQKIDESDAPTHIKKLLKERQEAILKPQPLMFSLQGQTVISQQIAEIIPEETSGDLVMGDKSIVAPY